MTDVQVYIILSVLSFVVGSIISFYLSTIDYQNIKYLKLFGLLSFVFTFHYFIPFSYLRKRYIRKETLNESQKSNLFAFSAAFGFASFFFIMTFSGNIFEFDLEILFIIFFLLIIGYFIHEILNLYKKTHSR